MFYFATFFFVFFKFLLYWWWIKLCVCVCVLVLVLAPWLTYLMQLDRISHRKSGHHSSDLLFVNNVRSQYTVHYLHCTHTHGIQYCIELNRIKHVFCESDISRRCCLYDRLARERDGQSAWHSFKYAPVTHVSNRPVHVGRNRRAINMCQSMRMMIRSPDTLADSY